MKTKIVTLVIIGFILMAMGGGVVALFVHTIVNIPMICLGVGLAAAGLAYIGWRWWRPLTGTNHWIPNVLAQFISGFVVLLCGILCINYFCADFSTAETKEAEITGKHTEKRYHTKRVGRRTMARGTEYTVYILHVTLPDGTVKKMEVPVSEYIKRKNHSGYPVEITQGALGMKIWRMARSRRNDKEE